MNAHSPSCPEQAQLLLLLQQDSLDPLLRENLENHIESCPNCQLQLQLDATHRCQNLPPQLLLQTPTKPAPNQILANCQLIKPLGHGAASIVWLALELPTNRKVALKLLPAQTALLNEDRNRWLAEVHIAARMQHPNLTRLYRVEETSCWFALIFEFVPGPTLAAKLREQVPTPQTAASILRTLASAVHAIHQQQVLHLDLKPSNILLDNSLGDHWQSLLPKISDFGISATRRTRDFSATPVPGASPSTEFQLTSNRLPGCGTPPWTAPEQLLLPPHQLTPAADVYALGSLLYALLTAHPPQSTTDSDEPPQPHNSTTTNPHTPLTQLLSQQIIDPRTLQPNLPPELTQICLKCLQKFPAHRFQSALELANALAPWTNTPADTSPQPRNTPKPAKLAAALASLTAIAALTAVLHTPQNSPPPPTSADNISQNSTEHFDSLLARDPAGLTQSSANQLAELAQHHTNTALATIPHSTPELLKLGRLLLRAGERINSSIHAQLYPTAASLIHNAERLLLTAHHANPADQRTLQELAAAQSCLGSLKSDARHSSPHTAELSIRNKVAKLIECCRTASRMSDAKQQIYWICRTLDACRINILKLQWSGNPTLASELRNSFGNSVIQLPAAQTPDVQFRLVLWNPRSISEQILPLNSNASTWTFPEDAPKLKLEAVCIAVANSLFSPPHSPPMTPEDARQILIQANSLIHALQLDPQTLPEIIHCELIRPVATIASEARSLNQIERAEQIQHAYLQLALAAEIQFPNHPEVLLALSEAHLQNWKNLLRKDLDQPAVNALQKSLAAAEAAWQAAPHSTVAYQQIADRLQRLERFKAGR